MAKRSRGFPPVVDADIETLILGSFPSEESLKKRQYYGHPQNQFWKLVGRVLDMPLYEMPYEERLRALLANHIGLWDIISTCNRDGSLDSNIRNSGHNDYARVTHVAKKLRRVCFNGKTAGKLEPLFIAWGYESVVLPSSSPAYTMRFEAKLKQWQQIAAVGPPGKRFARVADALSAGWHLSTSRLTPSASRRKC